MKDSLMYRLSYHRFGELKTIHGKPKGFDKMRNCEIGHKVFDLKHFRESFTSK
jgi:dolichyl-diphosphooligosaccharide--protein glycosyltransferase